MTEDLLAASWWPDLWEADDRHALTEQALNRAKDRHETLLNNERRHRKEMDRLERTTDRPIVPNSEIYGNLGANRTASNLAVLYNEAVDPAVIEAAAARVDELEAELEAADKARAAARAKGRSYSTRDACAKAETPYYLAGRQRLTLAGQNLRRGDPVPLDVWRSLPHRQQRSLIGADIIRKIED